jgi:hypothetical protein
MAVLRGEKPDRVPFCQYVAPGEEFWPEIGRENVGVMRWVCAHRVEHPNCRFESKPIERTGLPGKRITLHTPAGSITEEFCLEPTYGTASRHEHFIKTREDYFVLIAYLKDLVITEDYDTLHTHIADIGDDGLVHCAVDVTPFQQLWIQWVSLIDLCCHMVDWPDVVEECVVLMTKNQKQIFEIAAGSPAPYIDGPDNVTAPVIGENYFRKYCMPAYAMLADILDGKNKPVFVHMDGDLKPLWEAIGESRINGIDSFSPPPDNDTSVADAVKLWPEMRLFVNYPSSVHLSEPQVIYDKTMQILSEGGHTGRLVIGVFENVPPGMWRKSFPEIVRAIRDFGTP